MTWSDIEPAVPPRAYYRAQTALIVLENTHNMAGGTVAPSDIYEDVCDRAHERGIPVHLDGARIFNAAAATGKSVAEMTRKVDSIMFCVSKGLGAPVGSLILGSREFIERAWVFRKMFGGGMRQVGVLAAAGLVALDESPSILLEDHRRAKRLADGLREINGVSINHQVDTNIVVFDVSQTGVDAGALAGRLKERGVLVGAVDSKTMRVVTHYDVDDAGVEQALDVARAAIGKAAES
jgi:threonine aldolase